MSSSWRRDFRVVVIFSALAALAWLCWKGARDPAIPLLPPGPGGWIIYPSPPHAKINVDKDVPSDFVRELVLASVPERAEIRWRAFRRSELSVNEKTISLPAQMNGNWKRISRLDAKEFLRPGTNTIEVTVWNSNGPPALSLCLDVDGASVKTDHDWSVSVAGSVWRSALLASATAQFGEGSDLLGLEETGPALRECWPWLCVLLAFSVLAAAGLEFAMGRVGEVSGFKYCRWGAAVVAAVWVLLFVHNAFLLPKSIGFDASAHLQYISYIQDHKSLPSPKDGWEMFQGPLYYVLSACVLWAGHLKTSQWDGLLLLRWLNVAIGAANVALIYAGLRLVFPGHWKKQAAGALLAAFLPAQICLLHYTTNETLSATLMTAAFYLCLRILRAPAPATGLHAGLGCILGLALLAKVSAIVFMPVIFAVLAGKLILERQTGPMQWLRTIALAALCAALVAGWRYVGVWQEFGNPLIGNWDPRIAAPWWQDPGCHTAGYFLSFGRSLTAPLFSGFDSFWDCFYTTLWGDGLAGGAAATSNLPPWNYSLMDAGFLLALAPSALVLTGLCAAVARCLQKPDLTYLLLIGTACSAGFAVLYMSMKLAFYSQGKCFYGLPALLPFCVFGVLGLDFWARRGRIARVVLGAAMLMWVCNVYASFWIRPGALQTEVYTALAKSAKGVDEVDARRAVDKLLQDNPTNVTGLVLRSEQAGPAEAVEGLREVLRSDPGSGEIAMRLAFRLRDLSQTNEAFALAQHAAALAPENLQAATLACGLATEMGKNEEALDAGRLALGLDPGDPTLHLNVGCAWANLRDPAAANRQFQMVLALNPPPAMEEQAHFYLGRLLAGQPARKAEAVAQFQAALRLEPDNAECRRELEKLQSVR